MTDTHPPTDATDPDDSPADGPGGPTTETGPAVDADPLQNWEVDLSDAEAVHECPHCGRPFRTAHQRALHLGEDHEGRLTDDQRAAYEAAVEEEEDDLFLFHMKVVVALGVLYSTTALGYTAIVGLTG